MVFHVMTLRIPACGFHRFRETRCFGTASEVNFSETSISTNARMHGVITQITIHPEGLTERFVVSGLKMQGLLLCVLSVTAHLVLSMPLEPSGSAVQQQQPLDQQVGLAYYSTISIF
jgi:hypothetical protein